MKEPSDTWDMKRALEQADYDSLLSAIKYNYDTNKTGIIDDNEVGKSQINITLDR